MTDAAAAVTTDENLDEADAEVEAPAEAPAGHYFADVKGHQLLVKEVSPAQSIVLGGLMRDMRDGAETKAIMDTFGKLMTLLRALLPRQADIDYLEYGSLNGTLELPDFAFIFVSARTDATKGPVAKKPRRGRS